MLAVLFLRYRRLGVDVRRTHRLLLVATAVLTPQLPATVRAVRADVTTHEGRPSISFHHPS